MSDAATAADAAIVPAAAAPKAAPLPAVGSVEPLDIDELLPADMAALDRGLRRLDRLGRYACSPLCFPMACVYYHAAHALQKESVAMVVRAHEWRAEQAVERARLAALAAEARRLAWLEATRADREARELVAVVLVEMTAAVEDRLIAQMREEHEAAKAYAAAALELRRDDDEIAHFQFTAGRPDEEVAWETVAQASKASEGGVRRVPGLDRAPNSAVVFGDDDAQFRMEKRQAVRLAGAWSIGLWILAPLAQPPPGGRAVFARGRGEEQHVALSDDGKFGTAVKDATGKCVFFPVEAEVGYGDGVLPNAFRLPRGWHHLVFTTAGK